MEFRFVQVYPLNNFLQLKKGWPMSIPFLPGAISGLFFLMMILQELHFLQCSGNHALDFLTDLDIGTP